MEFKPPKHISDTTYTVPIETDMTVLTEYEIIDPDPNHTYPPEDNPQLRNCVAEIANQYETYSKKWFSAFILCANFIQRSTHSWDFGSFPPYVGNCSNIIVRQTWRPEQIRILPRSFQIQWKLIGVQYIDPNARISGQDGPDDEDIPLATDGPGTHNPLILQTSLRARAKRKLRKARLKAAVAKFIAQELTRRYYEKYGTLEGADRESVLSSDADSDSDIS